GSYPQILEKMREANFITMFCGIETPNPDALRAMRKTQNLRIPILEVVEKLNAHGIEVAAGIILGLDTDTDETADAIVEFAGVSNIPILTVNLLYALPKTALYDRLERDNRLNSGEGRDSNVDYLRGYETTYSDWQGVVRRIYSPEAIYSRFEANCETTYRNRWVPENPWSRLTWGNLRRAFDVMARMIWHVGIKADYRAHFWKMAWRELRRGHVENVFHIGFIAHHLILYARECLAGVKQASNYSARDIEPDSETVPV
ncbi:MAG: DUF4070 domain-containing protein, partial [Verrucomicrobiae bacterium]|nr:DUF4070 domain-containing protein [Verrucomicrobiae bacterium]